MRLLELHLHLEGSVSPERLRQLAERHGVVEAPRICLTPRGQYRDLADFADFLDLYKAVNAVLRTPWDFHAVALDLGVDLAEQGVVYAEVTVGYGVLQRRGLDPLAVQTALAEAAAEIETTRGVILRWLPDAVRQWGADAAWRALEAACKAGSVLGVVGFGMGGEEDALPAALYAEHFAAAHNEGLGTTLHAGEVGGPEAVRDAVAVGVRRIGHGTAAGGDPATLALLAAAGTFVELCPGSNVRTGVVASLDEYPLRAFLDAGVPCCLNTDDPQLFDLSLRDEYAAAATVHGLTNAETAAMQAHALAAAFVDDDLRGKLAARLTSDEDA